MLLCFSNLPYLYSLSYNTTGATRRNDNTLTVLLKNGEVKAWLVEKSICPSKLTNLVKVLKTFLILCKQDDVVVYSI